MTHEIVVQVQTGVLSAERVGGVDARRQGHLVWAQRGLQLYRSAVSTAVIRIRDPQRSVILAVGGAAANNAAVFSHISLGGWSEDLSREQKLWPSLGLKNLTELTSKYEGDFKGE